MRPIRFPLMVGIGLVSTLIHSTSLQVLYDNGETLPLGPLLVASGFREATRDPPPPARLPKLHTILNQHITVQSPSLSPGVQERLPVGQAGSVLARPLFVVGSDPQSLAWLRRHQARLHQLHAVGLVVNMTGIEEFQRVRTLAGERPLAVGSGEWLAEHFGLRHYPVLIGPQWIEQ